MVLLFICCSFKENPQRSGGHYIKAYNDRIPVPHVQRSLQHINPSGETYWHPDRTFARPMTQADIRLVVKYIRYLKSQQKSK